MKIKNIFIIGGGTMGAGIAQTTAVSGYQITLMDVDPKQLTRANGIKLSKMALVE